MCVYTKCSLFQAFGSNGGLRQTPQILEMAATICTWACMLDCRSCPWHQYVF